MPKKFGTNTKKEEARERKNKAKKDAKEKKEREEEDEYWREKDPKIVEKINEKKRKEREKEEKMKEKLLRKEELKKEEEEIISKTKKIKEVAPTRKEILETREREIKEVMEREEKKEEDETHNPADDIDVEKEFINENYSKLIDKTDNGIDIIEASGIDKALLEMNLLELDKHPEKRMKKAWTDFFDKQLPIYKEQYPNLKRTQYINMISKEFKTSVDNPVYLKNIMAAKKNAENSENLKNDENK